MGTGSVDFGIAERDRLPAQARNVARRFRHFSDGPIEDLGPVVAARDECSEKHSSGATAIDSRLADRFEVADEVRTLAECSVAQARQAFDGFIGAAHCALDAFSGQAQTAGEGAKNLTDTAITFAKKDIAISFEFATRLARARDIEEVLRLQAEYLQAQVQLFSEPLVDEKSLPTGRK
jgi:hypothetical protein